MYYWYESQPKVVCKAELEIEQEIECRKRVKIIQQIKAEILKTIGSRNPSMCGDGRLAHEIEVYNQALKDVFVILDMLSDEVRRES